ncbi:magnesium transporter CorA, partial [Patescibacteria group bacterium]|nr:magnesium transporter CorA [Patescibacteria group bacterium]
ELALYFDDILDAIERQWSMLDTAKEMIEALQDTHESWLTHKTNAVVRILTVFSVTMLPLTVITGFFGMNVTLPYQQHQQAFLWLMFGMITLLVGLIAYFAKKGWL